MLIAVYFTQKEGVTTHSLMSFIQELEVHLPES